jgi:CheY-like chemotaxis protein
VVLLEPNAIRRAQLVEQFKWPNVDIDAVGSGAAMLKALEEGVADSIVLCIDPQDMSLAALAEKIQAEPQLQTCPLLLHIADNLPAEEMHRWTRLAQEFNLKLALSPTHLADQLAVSLCIPHTSLPEAVQKNVQNFSQSPSVLAGKKVLIVDDDIRNIFALTSILERYDMVTVSAETGRDAINLLQAARDVDIVLMDIMMPEMDGIDTTKAIRQMANFKKLPIVAVTAKAMKGDREKCIEAGAWDYLSKPVDSERMLAVLRAWLTV